MKPFPLLHHGYDGLDVALKGALPPALLERLATAKQKLIYDRTEFVAFEVNGLMLQLADTGMSGGYAFRCDSGPEGATWCFKNSNSAADWNIRVSFKSYTLHKLGLHGAKGQLYETLERLEAIYSEESISRADYAFDFLMPPEFTPCREDFITHPRITKSSYFEPTPREIARGHRVQTLTFGKQPGAQVTLYDNRADIITKRKEEYWQLWNDELQRQDLPVLNPKDTDCSRVWRIELRAGKTYLKERCGITKWHELEIALPALLQDLTDKVSYRIPIADTNCSRWPLHPLWQQLQEQITAGIGSDHKPAPTLKPIRRMQLQDMIDAQISGLAGAYAVANGIQNHSPQEIAASIAHMLQHKLPTRLDRLVKGIERAKGKYALLD